MARLTIVICVFIIASACVVSCMRLDESDKELVAKRARVNIPFKWGKRSFDSSERSTICDTFLLSILERSQNENDQFSVEDVNKMDACYLSTREQIIGKVKIEDRISKRYNIPFRWGRK